MKTRSSWRCVVLLLLSALFALVSHFSGTATTADSNRLTLTVLYDNIPFDKNLKTHWGFSCLVEKGSTRVLFDTGANGDTLLRNLKGLRLDIARLDAIVFSHIHADHTQGYRGLAAEVVTDPPVYVPDSFPADFKQQFKAIDVRDSMILPDRDFLTTGELPAGPITEQALIIRSERGLVVLTGCAHPGVVDIVRGAKEISGERILMVMGGFHLIQTPATEVEKVAKELRVLGVERIAPSHCTGEPAIEIFKKEYGADFVPSGAGKILHID